MKKKISKFRNLCSGIKSLHFIQACFLRQLTLNLTLLNAGCEKPFYLNFKGRTPLSGMFTI